MADAGPHTPSRRQKRRRSVDHLDQDYSHSRADEDGKHGHGATATPGVSTKRRRLGPSARSAGDGPASPQPVLAVATAAPASPAVAVSASVKARGKTSAKPPASSPAPQPPATSSPAAKGRPAWQLGLPETSQLALGAPAAADLVALEPAGLEIGGGADADHGNAENNAGSVVPVPLAGLETDDADEENQTPDDEDSDDKPLAPGTPTRAGAGVQARTPSRRLDMLKGQQQPPGSPATRGILTPSRRGGLRDPATIRKTVTFGSREKKSLQDPLPPSSMKKKGTRGRPKKKLDDPVMASEEDVKSDSVVDEVEDAVHNDQDHGSDKDEEKDDDNDDDEVCVICAKPDSKPPNEILFCDGCNKAVHQQCYDVAEIPKGDWLCRECALATDAAVGSAVTAAAAAATQTIPHFAAHLARLQRTLLDRCTGRARLRLVGLDDAYATTRRLVEQTVLAGESNSMMVIGPRGSGKTTMVESIIGNLRRRHRRDFHVVRLSGFVHTDDKLAMREIWRQLGREMELEDEMSGRTNHADTMASLLALLSHPEEIAGAAAAGLTSQSVVFAIDELDMFAAHARQTLLYNLFDIAQSRKAPIAVLGLTTRLDVVEMLEKRVKSRFSHRYVYLALPRSVDAFWAVCREGLGGGQLGLADENGDDDDDDDDEDGGGEDDDNDNDDNDDDHDNDNDNGNNDSTKTVGNKRNNTKNDAIAIKKHNTSAPGWQETKTWWRNQIDTLHATAPFQQALHMHYFTTKSVPEFLNTFIVPLSLLTAANPILAAPTLGSAATLLPPADPRLALLPSLSDVELALLIAAARLDIVAHADAVNLAMAYDEYVALTSRQRAQQLSSRFSAGFTAAAAVGARVWGRPVAARAWERLVDLGLLLAGGAGGAARSGGGVDAKMWRVGVALEEIPTAVKLGALHSRWCKEV